MYIVFSFIYIKSKKGNNILNTENTNAPSKHNSSENGLINYITDHDSPNP